MDMINDICGHVGDNIKSRYTDFELSSKIDYMNLICPWYLIEQPLVDVRNNAVIEPAKVENSKFIPFVKGMVG
jgi:hypothetical protein